MEARVQKTPVMRTVERWCADRKQPTADAAETIAEQFRNFPQAQLVRRLAGKSNSSS